MTGWGQSLEIFGNFQDPVGLFAKTDFVKKKVQDYPLLARTTLITVNAPVGLIKPFLFPIISTIALVISPIMALYRFVQGNDESSKKWLKVSVISFTSLAAVTGFMALTAYKLTLMQGTYAVIGLCTLSLVAHVYRVV